MKRLLLFTAMLIAGSLAMTEEIESAEPAGTEPVMPELFEEAHSAYQAGDNLGAFKYLRQAIFSVWDDIPLTVLEPTLVTDQRSYTPKENNIYNSGETVYIVCRLVGYNIKEVDSLYHFKIASDIHILDEEKNILMGLEDFGLFDITTPFPNTEFKVDLNYSLNLPPGKYILQTTFRDQNSDKSTKFTKTVRIEE